MLLVFTLFVSQDDLKAVTTAATSASFTADRVWLNGVEVDTRSNVRIITCFNEVRNNFHVIQNWFSSAT